MRKRTRKNTPAITPTNTTPIKRRKRSDQTEEELQSECKPSSPTSNSNTSSNTRKRKLSDSPQSSTARTVTDNVRVVITDCKIAKARHAAVLRTKTTNDCNSTEKNNKEEELPSSEPEVQPMEVECTFEPSVGKPHPMLIPNVLNQLFHKLPFNDLKSCRSVCHEWDDEIYHVMKGHVLVTITNYKRLKDYAESYANRKKFCTEFEFGRGLNIGAPTMVRFLEEFGSFIQTVSFQLTKWKEKDLTDALFTKLTNLEHLTIDCFVPKWNENNHYFEYNNDNNDAGRAGAADGADNNNRKCKLYKLKTINMNVRALETGYAINHPNSTIKTFLLDLFSVSPNLETISCPKSETNYQPLEFLFPLDPVHVNHFINGEVLDALDELNGMGFESNIRRVLFDTLVNNDVGQSIKLEKLSVIDINLTLREEHIRKLHLKHFPLKCIDVIVTQNVTVPTLHQFLSSIGGTLKTLGLRFLRRSTCTTEFPSSVDLKTLESLTLNGFKGSMEFVRHFKSLETLIVIKPPKLSSVFPLVEFDFGGRSPLPRMKRLEIYEVEKSSLLPNYRPQLIERFARNFPNLKRLGLENIGDATLRAIYTHLSNIEELILKNGIFTDSGLVGVSQQICDEIRGRGNLREEEYILQRQFPFVGHLRNLKRFELTSKHMTDVGVVLGVIYCPALTHLTITAYGITNTSLYKIADDMSRLDYLKTEFCSQLTTSAVEYIESKMKGKQISINEYEGPMSSTEMWKFLKRNNGLALTLHKLPN